MSSLTEEVKEIDNMTDAELDREPTRLTKAYNKIKLPFESAFFEDAVETIHHDLPIAEHPELLITRTYKEWFASDTVLPYLQQWKALVVDDMNMRIQLKNGFTTNEQTAWDTLDCLRGLCFQQGGKEKASETDAWDATAWFALILVKHNQRAGSRICGMAKKGQLDWCFDVMLRLLITVYTDMLRTKDGYFETLLGGPPVEPISAKQWKSDMLRIDNKPVSSKVNEMEGLHGYNKLLRDYPWFRDIKEIKEKK